MEEQFSGPVLLSLGRVFPQTTTSLAFSCLLYLLRYQQQAEHGRYFRMHFSRELPPAAL